MIDFESFFDCSQGSIVVDAEIIFNDVSSLPNASSVAQTLATAASSSNFSLSVNTSSIVATGKTNMFFWPKMLDILY